MSDDWDTLAFQKVMLPFEKWNTVQDGFTYAWDSLKCFELKYTIQNFAVVTERERKREWERRKKETKRKNGEERQIRGELKTKR